MNRHDLFPNADLIDQYRSIFSSPAGKKVLTSILFDLGVFEETTSEKDDIALKNYGIRLLNILGHGRVESYSLTNFIESLLKQPEEKKHE